MGFYFLMVKNLRHGFSLSREKALFLEGESSDLGERKKRKWGKHEKKILGLKKQSYSKPVQLS